MAALLTDSALPPAPQTLLEQAQQDGVVFPPGNIDSDEPPLESDLHRSQIELLIRLLQWLWAQQPNAQPAAYASGNLTIYYSPDQIKARDFRGPDFFVVLGAENRPRKSWVVWEEGGKYPNVIVELLSDSTAKVDRGVKRQLYQDIFRTPDYFWFDPHSLEFEGYHLVDGTYQPIPTTEQGWRWSEQLNLYLGIHQQRLRFFTANGTLLPTPEESAQAERQRAEVERQRAEQLTAQLQALGIEPGN